MQGTLFKIRVEDDEIAYSEPTENRFDVRYVRHKEIQDDEVQVAVSYNKQPAGIELQTNDGMAIKDGDHIALNHIAEPSSFQSDEEYESGRLVFTFDITNEHKPAMAWDEVQFTILFRGTEATSFTRRFGGYPDIHEDYDPETGEFTVL